MFMKLKFNFYSGVVLISMLSLFSCDGNNDNNREITPNPSPPYHWYPFENYPLTPADREAGRTVSRWNARKADHNQYGGRWFDSAQGDPACPTNVTSLTTNLTGNVTCNLSFNMEKRKRNYNTPGMIGGDKTLGPVGTGGFVRNQHYKFEVVIVYNNLTEGFYGQMISAPMDYSTGNMDIQFENDFPANDHNKLNWNLAQGETKAQFPVIEITGNTIHWIDGPQFATGFESDDQVRYVIIYAGACGVVTHMEILEIMYPRGGPPTAVKMSKNQFQAKAKSWSFKAP